MNEFREAMKREQRRILRLANLTADSDAAKEFLRNRYLREKRSRLITDQQLVENMMREYQDYSDDKYGGTDSEAIYRVALEVERLFYAE